MKDISCELWSINRWLRYTGWRLYVAVDPLNFEPASTNDKEPEPTSIGFVFYGWRWLRSEKITTWKNRRVTSTK